MPATTMEALRMFKWKPGDIFGDACVLCGLPGNGDRICKLCVGVLPWNDVVCDCCGQPVDLPGTSGVSCATCQQRSPDFNRARAPFLYAFPVDTALKKMKFRRQLSLAPAFAGLLLPVLRTEFANCDALVPVPLHRWRHVTRGFNQADELCRPLTRTTGLPVLDSAVRIRATRSQSGLSAEERRRNLNDAFIVRGKISCRHPLIIDDVITTGTTCNQLARALLHAGASKVSVLTVARSSR
jgi:ComF family protein